jgi:cob(I)alamin adenosyltransferase
LTNPSFTKRGYVQIYTGDGKGKTTACMGLALRALGQGWKVMIMQFTKGGSREKYGEFNALNSIETKFRKNLKYKNCGFDKVLFKSNMTDDDKLEILKGWWYILHNHDQYDLIIMDEINIVIDLDIIKMEDVQKLIVEKPNNLELVFSGRIANPDKEKKLFDSAHLVSKINPVKHYYEIGVNSREGIEY